MIDPAARTHRSRATRTPPSSPGHEQAAPELTPPARPSRRQQHSEGLQRLLQLDRRLQQPLDLQTVTRGDDQGRHPGGVDVGPHDPGGLVLAQTDRKSTRLNSSHVAISYAVFCLKKKKRDPTTTRDTP